ncbi:MAG TPA: P1 family peptidase [Chloroflexota bacterium]|nr:P1 family peptidase [Chloroflexota bacterium]
MTRARLRDLGISVGLLPTGEWNAITDVPGVKVGHTTLIEGSGPHVPGQGPIRTGVTAILPHGGNQYTHRVPAAIHVLNGAGEMTARSQVEEWGTLVTPIYLTSTHNVGLVYDAAVEYALRETPAIVRRSGFVIPVVAECNDGGLNDSYGRHVKKEHVFAALERAASGPVDEGNVGAGTGMVSYQYKGGIGTASRRVEGSEGYIVGALVLANHGAREHLSVGGVPVGRLSAVPYPSWRPPRPPEREGSIIMVVGTNAPLLPSQLHRLAVRATLGLARTGTVSGHGSGDIAIAFSVGNIVETDTSEPLDTWRAVRDGGMDRIFAATVEATEESVLNALTAAETLEGRDGRVAHAISLDELRSFCT